MNTTRRATIAGLALAPLATPVLSAKPNRIQEMVDEFHRLDDAAEASGDPREMIHAADRARESMLTSRPENLNEAISQIRFVAEEMDEGLYDDLQTIGIRNSLATLERLA